MRISSSLALFASLNLSLAGLNPALASINVNRSDHRQYISGFGAAANHPVNDLRTGLSPEQQDEVLDTLFQAITGDNLPGLDLSIVRLEINPFDSIVVQSNERNASGINFPVQRTFKPGPTTYDWTSDEHQRWFAKEAMARRTSRFLASVWSPPAWMKRNNSELNSFNSDGSFNLDLSRLKSDAFDELALYFEEYALHYANGNDINVSWISVQNEPSNSVPWAAAAYTSGQTGDMSRALEAIAQRFSASRIWPKILAPESEDPEGVDAYLTTLSPAALAAVDVVATHNYGSRDLSRVTARQGKPLWHLEGFPAGNPTTDASADGIFYGIRMAQDIRNALIAGSQTYIAWWSVAPFNAAPGLLQGLIRLVDSPRGYVITKRAYAMGQFSRYVRPGYYRVGSTSSNANLQTSAFHDPASGRVVIVVINPSSTQEYLEVVSGLTASTVDISRTSKDPSENITLVANDKVVSGGTVSVRFPPSSITTIVENVDHTPAPAQVTTLTAEARSNGILLKWIATGDNGNVGTADTYQIRRSNAPITNANFASATIVRGAPPAFEAGTNQSFLVTDGNRGTGTQYYALRVVDGRQNVSPVSNNASVVVP